MSIQLSTRISKTDFLLFCEAPRHLWAKKHGHVEPQLSDFDQHLIDEGGRVEELAQEYLTSIIIPQFPGSKLILQKTYEDEVFTARVDALVQKADINLYDLYEIKSSTKVDQEIIYDVSFQSVILEKNITVDHFYVLHLDKDYVRSGELDLSSLFIAEDISEKVSKNKIEVANLRDEAFRISQLKSYEDAEHCLFPKVCPYPDLCHPNLPEFSIFDIPRLSKDKKRQLLDKGITAASDIPISFDLDEKQRLVAELARTNTEHLNRESLKTELGNFQFPLWFLDYETCISAIPQYERYHPQQQIVFQYSLHSLDQLKGELKHFGHVAITPGDPSKSLLDHLSADMGKTGTVIVWNKTFERTMNKEMAKLYPEYAAFLEDLNDRIYDLGEIVNQGYYMHPGFKGSWSIKNVLPVMVPKLSYKELSINVGGQASMAWWNITFGDLDDQEKELLKQRLEEYCKLDTLAMVEIYRRFTEI